MGIEDIKVIKAKLDSDIEKMLTEFSKETGLQISSLDFVSDQMFDGTPAYAFQTVVRIGRDYERIRDCKNV